VFGDWLDEAIKARKLTQTKIAAACGVSQQAVSHWV
jgi:transcriptional regulator with XRE-family HTH domain